MQERRSQEEEKGKAGVGEREEGKENTTSS